MLFLMSAWFHQSVFTGLSQIGSDKYSQWHKHSTRLELWRLRDVITRIGLLCLHPCAAHCPAGLQHVPFTCIQMVLSQEYSSNHIEVVLGWTGEVKAGPCLPGLWLAQSLLLYIKNYFWRLGGKGVGGGGMWQRCPQADWWDATASY